MALVRARREAFALELEAMSPQERWKLVDIARHDDRWPDPGWLARHCSEKMPDLTSGQYLALAQSIKRRPGTQIYAFIHSSHGNAGLAFVDPDRRILVWYSVDDRVNLSCFYLEETVEAFLRPKGDLYWRLPDTELS
jgi:hypothetical protein